jgi:alginate O-acetyltransferase complex protein AlgI
VSSLVIPTLFVFLVLGFWHGANWTFVFFGGMHGLYIVINHLWRKFFPVLNNQDKKNQSYRGLKLTLGWLLTFLAVNITSVMFRADSVPTAIMVYKGMLGVNGFSLGHMPDIQTWIFSLKVILLTMTAAFFIVLLMPNTINIASVSEKKLGINNSLTYVSIFISLVIIYVLLQFNFYESPFLYFQF